MFAVPPGPSRAPAEPSRSAARTVAMTHALLAGVLAIVCCAPITAQAPKADASEISSAAWVNVGESEVGSIAFSIVSGDDASRDKNVRIRLRTSFRSDTPEGR